MSAFLIRPMCVLSAAIALTACSQEKRERPPAQLETFAPAIGTNYACVFRATNGENVEADLVFVTLLDDPQNEAQVEYAGERLKLFPKAPPVYDLAEQEVLYSVENYAGYDLRLVMRRDMTEGQMGLYEGEIELRQFQGETPELIDMRDFVGSCGV